MKVLSTLAFLTMLATAPAADSQPIATAINTLGLELYRTQAKADTNALLSPYSIQLALAMTYAGADGDTRAEMQRVLHFPTDDAMLHDGFAKLGAALETIAHESVERVKGAKRFGGPSTPIEFNVANRLFVRRGYALRQPFVELLKDQYRAPVEQLDFAGATEPSRAHINQWVEEQTRQKIRELISPGAIKPITRLVLANALYLRAPWASPFLKMRTAPEPFAVKGRDRVDVPTMSEQAHLGYATQPGFKTIALPYDGRELQFLIVLPDEPNGLESVERQITPKLLADCAKLSSQELILHLPKLRFEPPTLALSAALKQLGLRSPFDLPPGSANFNRMAPPDAAGPLAISEVLHKTFLALDEDGTEAAAATAVIMAPTAAMQPKPKPIEVRVDRPFLFAIQHVESGACLFLGRVVDPR